MILSFLVVFLIVLLAGLISVTGGNGLIIMPSLLILGYDIKEVLVLVRASAVVFVFFNIIGAVMSRQKVSFDKKDFIITITACTSILISVALLSKLDHIALPFFIALILIGLFFLVIFKDKLSRFSTLFIIVLPIFSGICGSVIGGAGLIISIIYLLLGFDYETTVRKRLIPSLIVQVFAFLVFLNQDIQINYSLMIVIIIATAIAGYLNMRIFFNLSSRAGRILFYGSYSFSISALLENAIGNILNSYGLSWIDFFYTVISLPVVPQAFLIFKDY